MLRLLWSGCISARKKINLNHKLGLVKRFSRKEGVLMDIGAGTGDFVKYAQDRGWEAYGVEPNEAARERAHYKGVPVYSRITVQQDAIYDAITLWHVLEHLPDLEQEIRTISNTLKPGGWLILAVPNYKSLDAKYYKSDWAAYDVAQTPLAFFKEFNTSNFWTTGIRTPSCKTAMA